MACIRFQSVSLFLLSAAFAHPLASESLTAVPSVITVPPRAHIDSNGAQGVLPFFNSTTSTCPLSITSAPNCEMNPPIAYACCRPDGSRTTTYLYPVDTAAPTTLWSWTTRTFTSSWCKGCTCYPNFPVVWDCGCISTTADAATWSLRTYSCSLCYTAPGWETQYPVPTSTIAALEFKGEGPVADRRSFATLVPLCEKLGLVRLNMSATSDCWINYLLIKFDGLSKSEMTEARLVAVVTLAI
ncbi:hypothetical protein FA15DRAFT_674010 [Coprinopsis marcescibilis]|uniref:Uncharacterized protein n=1 Tax=Coprinopsis marcescibilis TaxID=230819 RepID=A0A5C3KID6_COPMA|nr:hypothetical protein FA15DRAFT_674010 [Coprinopsis marcescibilis]